MNHRLPRLAIWLTVGAFGAALVLGLVYQGLHSGSIQSLLVRSTATPTVTVTATPTTTLKPTVTCSPTPTATPTATTTPTPLPTVTPVPTATPLTSRLLDVPLFLQELPLSCEAAGMRMILAGILGTAPAESELLECMPRDENPYFGFRGDPAGYSKYPDGSINWNNYGMYAPAVAETLNDCALDKPIRRFRARATLGTSYDDVAAAVLAGNPVMVWVTKQGEPVTITVSTPSGDVLLAYGEHVWVVVGVRENGTFDVHDPYPQKNGTQTLNVIRFPNWELFDNMAVFVEPLGN